jgi:hypothetical protein
LSDNDFFWIPATNTDIKSDVGAHAWPNKYANARHRSGRLGEPGQRDTVGEHRIAVTGSEPECLT